VTSQDFEFGVHVNISEFEEELRKRIGVLNENDNIIVRPRRMRNTLKAPMGLVTVYNVTLDNWSIESIAQGNDPDFTMDYDFFGHHTFSCTLPIEDLWDDFDNLWLKYLKDLFNLNH